VPYPLFFQVLVFLSVIVALVFASWFCLDLSSIYLHFSKDIIVFLSAISILLLLYIPLTLFLYYQYFI
jgi:hypothetical protein